MTPDNCRTMCTPCTIEALIAIILACIDQHYTGDVAQFTQNAMRELKL